MTLNERISELRRLEEEATKGVWMLYTSCSWRRIGLAFDYKEIIYPVKSASDGHPDLSGPNLQHDLELVTALRNSILPLLDLCERQREALLKAREEFCWHGNTGKSLAAAGYAELVDMVDTVLALGDKELP